MKEPKNKVTEAVRRTIGEVFMNQVCLLAQQSQECKDADELARLSEVMLTYLHWGTFIPDYTFSLGVLPGFKGICKSLELLGQDTLH